MAFNYDKALLVVQDNPFAADFLERNRSRLEELGLEAGQVVLLNVIDLFAAGRNIEAWRLYYGRDASWGTLAEGAAADVTGTAAMAARWAEAGAFLRECGVVATKALLALVVAGFCG